MPKIQRLLHGAFPDTFLWREPDGTLTRASEGYTGFTLEQRRPDGKISRFHGYEDYGLHLYPHLLRFLAATHARMPTVPAPAHQGNDDFVHDAKNMAEYSVRIPYPHSFKQGGFGNTPFTIRPVQSTSTKNRGLLLQEGTSPPIFVSTGIIRELVRGIPRIYPHVQSYKIMEAVVKAQAKTIPKLSFVKWNPTLRVRGAKIRSGGPRATPLRARIRQVRRRKR